MYLSLKLSRNLQHLERASSFQVALPPVGMGQLREQMRLYILAITLFYLQYPMQKVVVRW